MPRDEAAEASTEAPTRRRRRRRRRGGRGRGEGDAAPRDETNVSGEPAPSAAEPELAAPTEPPPFEEPETAPEPVADPPRSEARPESEPAEPAPAPTPEPAPIRTSEPDPAPAPDPDPELATREPLAEATLDDLSESTRAAITAMGWTELMPVQKRSIPYLKNDRDVMVQSRTGSGKTGGFVIPIIERLDIDRAETQALILVPTRELARQVSDETERLSAGSGVRSVAVYGGVAYGPQLDAIKAGAHIVVGTPGRVLDHLERGTLKLKGLKVLIFDEADRMLSMGFFPDMVAIRRHLPVNRASHMFSATYPERVKALASQFLTDPEFITLNDGLEHVAETAHEYVEVSGMAKHKHLVDLIEIENPESAIVFTNTRDAVNFVTVVLQRNGHDADQLSANLSQGARERVLDKLYKKQLRFLVATDVAARGIDINNLSHVFLYDFPEDPESYIHRTGRTGRAGASGTAISLVDVLELLKLKAVEKEYNLTIEKRETPTQEDVENVIATRATRALAAKWRELDNLVQERAARMNALVKRMAENEDDSRYLAMLLDEHYQEMLHGTPEWTKSGTTPAEEERRRTEARRESSESRGGGRGRGGDRGRRRPRGRR